MNKNTYLSKGGSPYNYRSMEMAEILFDLLETHQYKNVQKKSSTDYPDLNFSDNEEFWNSIINKEIDESQTICLSNFHILEWLPSSPGRFHTPTAKGNREYALENIAKYKDTKFTGYEQYAGNIKYKNKIPLEFTPPGKEGMVLGGVGSLRLSSKLIDKDKKYFLGATSNGVSPEGIPLIIDEDAYKEIIKYLKGNSGIVADVIGSVLVLPKEFSLIKFDTSIPRYCFYVKDFQFKKTSKDSEILSSIAITFSLHGDYTNSFSFCSFKPDPKDRNLKIAVEWLDDYTKRYSHSDKVTITGDFDEYYEHFTNVDFKLSDIMDGKISIETLKKHAKFFNLNINEIVLGDKFQNISESTIINKSKLNKSK